MELNGNKYTTFIELKNVYTSRSEIWGENTTWKIWYRKDEIIKMGRKKIGVKLGTAFFWFRSRTVQ